MRPSQGGQWQLESQWWKQKAFWLLVKHTRQQKLTEAHPGHTAMGSLQSSAPNEAEKTRGRATFLLAF